MVERMFDAKRETKYSALIQEWKATQATLRERMVIAPLNPLPRYVAGADCAFSGDKKSIYAVALVYDRIEQRAVEVAHVVQEVTIPYLPGYLSFREGPAVMAVIQSLQHEFGAICFDGQGYAHPRRCGLASHVSILLDKPGIGVAKSRFIGTFDDPAPEAGCTAPLSDAGECIGSVLRTRNRTRPVFVSVGHRIDLESAEKLALACVTRYRIPEPTRLADIEVAKLKRQHHAN